jgi:energy-coupling factor transporter ATP-binding protein EcfA2
LEAIISVEHLSYQYPDGTPALHDITFNLMPGEKVALIGANGAGKSSLLYQLNGILNGQGSVRVAGLEVKKPNLPRIRALVGLVFQDPDDQLFSPTVFEDVAFGPIHQGFNKEEVRRKVEEALATVKLPELSGRSPFHLSGGEKKRVAIATVLSMQPEILVLDEPTEGLDPRSRRELIDFLAELPQTMLIATHDLALAAQLTPRTLVLNQGTLVRDGETAGILADGDFLLENGLR